MNNLLFIYPKPEFDKNARFGYSLNLLYLAAIAKENNHNVIGYMDYSLIDYSKHDLYKKIELSNYIVIELDAFSLKRSSNASLAETVISEIKTKYPKKIIIAFGYDLALLPRKIKNADYSLSSATIESEFLKIIGYEQNLINYKKDTLSFDKLPLPSRNLLPKYIEYGCGLSKTPHLAKSAIIQTSIGCLNTCSFCQRQGWQNKYLTHSVDYVVSEFLDLKMNDYKNIWISDDNFSFNLKRAKEILKKLIEKKNTLGMKISCSSWTKIDKEFLNLAKKANVSIISFGVESANYQILKFYDKNIDLEYVKNLINYADSIGLYTVGNFIIGAPKETAATINNTFNYALETPFDQVNIKTLDYMIGSKLFESLPSNITNNKRHLFACKENGLNDFSLNTLKSEIHKFKKQFALSRTKKNKYKMINFGLPYFIKQ